MYLREHKEEYRILRNVSNPIIIAGLPLSLALIYLGAIIGAVLIAMILSAFNVGVIINIAVPGIITFSAVVGIKWFYSKYGLNGFYQSRKDSTMYSSIEGDMTIETILKQKIKENDKAI